MRRQRSHQHERLFDQVGNALTTRHDAAHTVHVEARHAVRKQTHALQEVVGDQRPVDIEFEITRGAAYADRDVVAHDLGSQHGERLALCRIDLARHDRAAWFVGGQLDFADATARS